MENVEDTELLPYVPRWPIFVHLVAAMFCFTCSSVYHLYTHHTEQSANLLMQFDYVGIAIMIAGSGTPPFYYSLMCNEMTFWRNFWFFLIILFNALAVCVVFIRKFQTTKYNFLRAIAFVLSGGLGFPFFIFTRFVDKEFLHHFEPWPWVLGGLMYIIGAIFYAFKFPEKWWPGKFDIFFSSH